MRPSALTVAFVARRLLAEAGAPRFQLRLDVRRIMDRYAEPLRASLAEAGLDVKVDLLDEDTFFQRVRGGQSSLYVLRFSCRRNGNGAARSDFALSNAPALAFAGRPLELPDDDEEQLPETDRAPRTPWLALGVAAVAALRLALLLTLHA